MTSRMRPVAFLQHAWADANPCDVRSAEVVGTPRIHDPSAHRSQDGRIMYHCLSLFLLAYLVWRRPVAGMTVGTLEGLWLLWPLYGLPELLSFNVHLTLAVTCLFAWRRDDLLHSVGLALGGAVVLGLPYYVPLGALGRPAAVLMGILCGELIVAAWVAAHLAYRVHSRDRDGQGLKPIRRILRAFEHLNAPLGTDGRGIVARPVGYRPGDPVPKRP
jgi:hypothetical protein